MNIIKKTIMEYGKKLDNVFVFPSRIAAMLWFQKSLELTGLKTIPLENYIAWDSFKEKCLISQADNLQPISNIVRNIFAEYICNKNAEEAKNSEPIFKSIIPKDSAINSTIFANWIASILPQLDHFEKRVLLQNKKTVDSEVQDLLLLKKMYFKFLKDNSFFEPSWVSTDFFSHDKNYFILYPELMEDFSEHKELLNQQDCIKLISCNKINNENIHLDIYDNARAEIRSVALQIEKLLKDGNASNEIAISIPDIENYSAYIKREFDLRGIPVEFRSGFKLGSEQSGKLFSLIYNCVENNFAFEFLKPIILNNHIPWKGKGGAEALIDYGVKNNCAVSWKENPNDSSYKNIWIETFKIKQTEDEIEEYKKTKARDWFYEFYNAANKICQSKTFIELQKNYFIFREKCINVEEFSEKDNAILGRCITTLQNLALLEEKLKDYMPNNRFSFFVSQLEKEIYVPKNTGMTVSIFPYRVAAGTPFKLSLIHI